MTRWMVEKSGTGIEKSGKSQNNQKKGEVALSHNR
jgi:hypothetical protein